MSNKMERFTERAQRVLSLTQEEAEIMQHPRIGTGHLLLGLMREDGGVAGRVLSDLGLRPTQVEQIIKRLTSANKRRGVSRMDLSPATKKVLELAVDEARRMGHHQIGTGHLLLGLVRHTDDVAFDVAVDVFRELNISPDAIRRRIQREFPENPQGESALQPGAVLQNRYRITGVIRVSGMVSVYQARDLRFAEVTRYVAVKVRNLPIDQSMWELTLKQFERESDMLASLSHPAIPEIYEYFFSKTGAYLVMEYISGRDLEVIINSTADFLPVEIVLRWAIDLCDVLGYLHQQKPEIIFRDVNPSNIMIDERGQIRLVGFGNATIFQEGQKGTMIGTEGYAAPEQYRGEATPASDVYGVGATLHHLLTRRDPRLEPPFTFAERSIQDVNPNVTQEFEDIVMKALELKPPDRYPNASLMKDALVKLGQL